MTHSSKKPALVSLGTALAGGLLLSGSSFAITPLAQGYMAGGPQATGSAKAAEGSCGGDKAKTDAKAGEGMCGIDRVYTDKDGRVSRAEFEALHPEDGEDFVAMDTNADGFVDKAEHEAHTAAGKADMEGKCGEGKCGGMA